MKFIGASGGVYRVDDLPFERATKVLDIGLVQGIAASERVDGVDGAAVAGATLKPDEQTGRA